jgi:23S rRNA pseudouridine2605 synthase
MRERKKSAGPRQRLPLSDEKRREIKFSGREQNEDEIAETARRRNAFPEGRKVQSTRYKGQSEDGRYEVRGTRYEGKSSTRKPYAKKEFGRDEDRPARKPYAKKEFGRDDDRPARKPYAKKEFGRDDDRPARKPYAKKEFGRDSDRPARKPYAKKEFGRDDDRPARKPYAKKEFGRDDDRPARKPYGRGRKDEERTFEHSNKRTFEKPDYNKKQSTGRKKTDRQDQADLIRLNKFIANAGICSRREADVLIQSGVIQVNGKPVTELGFKVSRNDKIQYGDQTLNSEKLQYVLLNKPKGFITTTDDPESRKTVMALVENACKERIYPVGRLDRNTTGLLLFTNDGEMAKKLTHPRYGIRKIYHVVVDKNVTKIDMKKIGDGIELEDELIQVDAIDYIQGADSKKEIGLQLHSGQNRVVRRLFETLGYKVEKLDRVDYAGLTKKNLPRGEWRFLTQMEINMLKMVH